MQNDLTAGFFPRLFLHLRNSVSTDGQTVFRCSFRRRACRFRRLFQKSQRARWRPINLPIGRISCSHLSVRPILSPKAINSDMVIEFGVLACCCCCLINDTKWESVNDAAVRCSRPNAVSTTQSHAGEKPTDEGTVHCTGDHIRNNNR